MKILLSGFFGEGNLGDETILQAILRSLPKECATVVTSTVLQSYCTSTVKRRGLASWPSFLRAVAQCKAAVFSGGILQDWSLEGVTFFALRIIAAHMLGAKAGLWGAGIGPLRRAGAKKLVSKALKRVQTAWLRDRASLELFNSLASSKGSLGADFSWFFDVKSYKLPKHSGFIGLNLRKWKYASLDSIVKRHLEGETKRIIGLAARNSDIAAIKKAAPNAIIVCPSSFIDFAAVCSGLSCCIGMRYHAVLAALRAKIPVRVCDYDPKVRQLAKEAGVLTIGEEPLNAYYSASSSFLESARNRYLKMQNALKSWVEG